MHHDTDGNLVNDPLNPNLRSRVLKGVSWAALESFCLNGIHLAVGIVLARLLFPEQFGLVAMVTVFIAISQTLLDGGFSSALIQKKNTSPLDESSVFYLNLVVGLALAILLCFSSPLIAAFYGEPGLVGLTCSLSAVLVIRSFGLVQQSLLTKRLDFRSQAKAVVLASLISGPIGIYMAFTGWGVWSLVSQQIIGALIQTSMYWLISPWRPIKQFSLAALRELFGFGSRMMISTLIDTAYHNLHSLVIGKVFYAASLGYYSRGREMALTPGLMVSKILNRVAFPALAELQDDRKKLVVAIRRALTMLAFFSFPAAVGLAVVAKPLVIVLLTDKWLPSVPILQVLCVAGALYPLQVIHLNTLKAIGRSDLILRLEIAKKILLITSLVCMIPFGLLAVVIGQAVTAIIAYLMNSYYTHELLSYRWKEPIKDFSPAIGCSLLMACVVWLTGLLPIHSQAVLLLLQIVVGIACYATASLMFQRPTVGQCNSCLPKRFRWEPFNSSSA